METQVSEGFWKWVNNRFNSFREELRKDSVASNPRKPVDCCNPPVYEKKVENPDRGGAQ